MYTSTSRRVLAIVTLTVAFVSSIHVHTQTVLTDIDNVTVLPRLTEIFGEVKCLMSAFDGRDRI